MKQVQQRWNLLWSIFSTDSQNKETLLTKLSFNASEHYEISLFETKLKYVEILNFRDRSKTAKEKLSSKFKE